MRVGLLDPKRCWPNRQVQVGALLGPRQLHVAALHVLGAVQRQQRPPLGAPLRAYIRPRIRKVHPPGAARRHLGVQVPARQPHRPRRLVFNGAHCQRPPAHVNPHHHGRGAVGDPQPRQGVGAQHHLVADRKLAVADRQPLGAKLPGICAEPLAQQVEAVDLGAAVGVDDRLLAGLLRGEPVAKQRPVALVGGLEGADALVLGVGGDRLVGPAGAYVVKGLLLPRLDLAAVLGQLGGAKPQP